VLAEFTNGSAIPKSQLGIIRMQQNGSQNTKEKSYVAIGTGKDR